MSRLSAASTASAVCPEEPSQMQVGLRKLLQAWDYARASDGDPWQFAEEVASLRAAGLSHVDLRWLLWQGHVAHAREIPSRNGKRAFEAIPHLAIPEETCFVLTDRGEALARGLLNGHKRSAEPPALPRWRSEARELWLGSDLVKRFRRHAPNQVIVLSAFEEEGWPHRIDDPLPPRPERDAYECVHNTINHLNRNQVQSLLHFFRDGTGHGICWRTRA